MSEYRYYIKKTYKPVSDIVVLELTDIRGIPVFNFKPGQYVMICYRNAKGRMEEKHAFSIASSPTNRDSIVLGIRIMGKFTTKLAQLKEGHEIFVSGPFGRFVFDENKHKEAVFIAGGVGITPFVSSLAYAANKQLTNKMCLLYSSRTLQGAVFSDEILEMGKRNGNIRFLLSITDEELEHKPGYVVTEKISADVIRNFVGQAQGKTFFLCGPVPFMDAMRRNLREIGAKDSQVETEEFSMIPDDGIWLKTRNMAYAFALTAVIFLPIFYVIQKSAKPDSATTITVPENANLNQPGNTTTKDANTNNAAASVEQLQPQQEAVSPAPAPLPDRQTRTS